MLIPSSTHRQGSPSQCAVAWRAAALALLMALSGAPLASAAEQGVSWSKAGAETFQDLPGVKPLAPDPLADGYTCETGTMTPSLGAKSRSLRDSLPYTVYRCEKDGVVYQGTQPPSHGRMWYPGVNPRNID